MSFEMWSYSQFQQKDRYGSLREMFEAYLSAGYVFVMWGGKQIKGLFYA